MVHSVFLYPTGDGFDVDPIKRCRGERAERLGEAGGEPGRQVEHRVELA
jgi:hypothetical protein